MTRRDGSMSLHSYRPGPPLSRFVRSLWLYQSGPQPFARARGLPTGTAQIAFDLSGDGLWIPASSPSGCVPTLARALFKGADTRYFLDEGGHAVHHLGVDFKPGGTYPFFGPPASELRDAHLPLETLWGIRAVDEPRERLMRAQSLQERFDILEAVLLGHLAHQLKRHPAVIVALRAFSAAPRGPVIAQIADQLALSHQRFIQVFRGEVGLGPKQFYRVRRFYWVVQAATREERPNWAQLALDFGYYDQAHFTRDFQQFAGVSPTTFLRDRSADLPTYLTLPNVDTPTGEALSLTTLTRQPLRAERLDLAAEGIPPIRSGAPPVGPSDRGRG
jgi:AraC-like DNA-binding protein